MIRDRVRDSDLWGGLYSSGKRRGGAERALVAARIE